MTASLHDTRLMQRVQQALPQLTPALRKVAEHLLRHPLLAATQGIEEWARACDASPAAVNRFASSMGYAGFAALKAELGATLQAVASPLNKLAQQLDGTQRHDTFGKLIAVSQANLQTTADNLSVPGFDAVVGALCAARRVYVIGFGNSCYLAGLAASNLAPYCDAQLASAEGGNENAAYKLAGAGGEDVLLAISLPRYSRDTVQLARFAAERGARVVAITDSPASPLAAVASHALYAAAEHPVLSAANSAVLALIEALVAAVMLRNPDVLRLSAELSESLLDYLYVDQPLASPRARGQ